MPWPISHLEHLIFLVSLVVQQRQPPQWKWKERSLAIYTHSYPPDYKPKYFYEPKEAFGPFILHSLYIRVLLAVTSDPRGTIKEILMPRNHQFNGDREVFMESIACISLFPSRSNIWHTSI